MDFTAVDFFKSKYVRSHPDIMGMIDPVLINTVKNQYRVLDINDYEARKQQEAAIIWRWISSPVRDAVYKLFDVWIGNNINVAIQDTYVKEDDKTRVKKYNIIKKKTRKRTTPIYRSSKDEKHMDLISINETKNYCDYEIYRLIFERLIFKRLSEMQEMNTIWRIMRTDNYGDKSEKPFATARTVIIEVDRTFRQFNNIFSNIILAIHNVLVAAGIYDDYPTFSDYKNLAAHIILKGRDYCQFIVNNPQQVRQLLEYDEFHPIWTNCDEKKIKSKY